MKILITGGSGDLGILLARSLDLQGDTPVRLDIRPPANPQRGTFIHGSLLDRSFLSEAMRGCEMVVHIAAWHGFHLVAGQKDAYDFWDLNVSGTFNVFEEAAQQKINKFIYISSTSIADRFGIYGHTKVLGEEIALVYHQRHGMDVIVLRPGAFIPYWNAYVYATFADWAKWYWKGAVHITDVLQSLEKSIALLKAQPIPDMPLLYVDGKYEYTPQDLQNWESAPPGAAFDKYYSQYAGVVEQYNLDPTLKPEVFDIAATRQLLEYTPTYSFMNLLQELAEFGPKGPPAPNL